MTGDSKDARRFFTVKKKEQEKGIKLELSFIDSLFMIYKLRRKIVKCKQESKLITASSNTLIIMEILTSVKV